MPHLNPEIPATVAMNTKPIVFRNSRFFIAWIVLLGVVGMVAGAGMTLMALDEIVTPWHSLLPKIWDAILWAIAACYSALLGFSLFRTGLEMTFYEARLDGRGVDFRLGSRKQPCVEFFSWDQVAAVKHKRVSTDQYYAVVGTDQRVTPFTHYTFFRAQKLARQIAAHAGRSIEEILS
jgi:hypothetical protein